MKYWSLLKSDPMYLSYLKTRTDVLWLKGLSVDFESMAEVLEFGTLEGYTK